MLQRHDDDLDPSFLMRVMSNPLTAVGTVVGFVLFVTGLVSLGMIIGYPESIEFLVNSTLSQNTALLICGAMAISGLGCLFFTDYVSKETQPDFYEHANLFT